MAEKCNTIRRAATAVAILPQDKHRPPLFDIKALKKRIDSRWLDVHEALAPSLTDALRNPGEHVPCPVHSGDDGFRFFDDVEVTGGGVCNTCGKYRDGIALLQWVNGSSFAETIKAIQAWLNENPEDGVATMLNEAA